MKKNLKVIYLDHDGYIKWYRDRWEAEFIDLHAEKSWNRKHKWNIDGIEYVQFIEHPDFDSKEVCNLARKYGYETIEEIEWTTL